MDMDIVCLCLDRLKTSASSRDTVASDSAVSRAHMTFSPYVQFHNFLCLCCYVVVTVSVVFLLTTVDCGRGSEGPV